MPDFIFHILNGFFGLSQSGVGLFPLFQHKCLPFREFCISLLAEPAVSMDILNGDTTSAQALDSLKPAHGILIKDPAVVLVPAAGEKGEGKGKENR